MYENVLSGLWSVCHANETQMISLHWITGVSLVNSGYVFICTDLVAQRGEKLELLIDKTENLVDSVSLKTNFILFVHSLQVSNVTLKGNFEPALYHHTVVRVCEWSVDLVLQFACTQSPIYPTKDHSLPADWKRSSTLFICSCYTRCHNTKLVSL